MEGMDMSFNAGAAAERSNTSTSSSLSGVMRRLHRLMGGDSGLANGSSERRGGLEAGGMSTSVDTEAAGGWADALNRKFK